MSNVNCQDQEVVKVKLIKQKLFKKELDVNADLIRYVIIIEMIFALLFGQGHWTKST